MDFWYTLYNVKVFDNCILQKRGKLTCLFVWPVCLFVCLFDWLINWLIDWLIDCYRLYAIFIFNADYSLYHDSLSTHIYNSLADPGGAPGARPPPNGRGPMIFYAPNANVSQFFSSLASLAITLSIILIEIWSKHATNWLLLQHVNTFNYFLHPPPVDKVHAPLKVKSWIRHCNCTRSHYK